MKKNFQSLNLGQRGKNTSQNQVFFPSSQFGLLIFIEIAYIDSLQQCITSSRGKSKKKKKKKKKKKWGSYLGQNGLKSGFKVSFLLFFRFASLVFLKITCNDSQQLCLTSSRGKTYGKNGDQILAKMGKNQTQNQFFPHFLSQVWLRFFCHFVRFYALVVLSIVQDDSLEQCLITSIG